MEKPILLSREALGTRRFKYTVAVTMRPDGMLDLVVAAAGLQGEHRMPEPARESRPFTSRDLDDLGVRTSAFLEEWRKAQPESASQVTCCSLVVSNALKRARAKLASLAAGPEVRRIR